MGCALTLLRRLPVTEMHFRLHFRANFKNKPKGIVFQFEVNTRDLVLLFPESPYFSSQQKFSVARSWVGLYTTTIGGSLHHNDRHSHCISWRGLLL